MPRDNVDIVRRLNTELGRTPAEQLPDFVAEFFEPNADYYPVRKFPDQRPMHGRDEIRGWLSAFSETWESFDFVVKHIVAVSDDRVLVHAAIRAEGHAAHVSLEGDIYQCVWLRNGHILRWEDHLTEAGALDALGVSRASLDTATPGEGGSRDGS
jgi:hypothetical protein